MGFNPEIEDSLRTLHPRMWARWLELHGIKDDYYSKPFNRDSLNVRCVGRWSYGPSYEITEKWRDKGLDEEVMGKIKGVTIRAFRELASTINFK